MHWKIRENSGFVVSELVVGSICNDVPDILMQPYPFLRQIWDEFPKNLDVAVKKL